MSTSTRRHVHHYMLIIVFLPGPVGVVETTDALHRFLRAVLLPANQLEESVFHCIYLPTGAGVSDTILEIEADPPLHGLLLLGISAIIRIFHLTDDTLITREIFSKLFEKYRTKPTLPIVRKHSQIIEE